MAKQRIVNTRFWADDYTANLDPTEKLLFFYFLTNSATDICGIYELPLKTVASESGIEKDMVERILKRFARDKKIFYVNGWIAVVNFIKHQTLNPSVKKGIEIGLKKVPREIVDKLGTEWEQTVYSLLDLNTNINTNSNLNPNTAVQISDLIKSFEEINPACKKYYGNTTQRTACSDLIESYGFERVKTVVDKTLPKIKGKLYFPTITTPLQLREKWAILESAILRGRNEKLKHVENVIW